MNICVFLASDFRWLYNCGVLYKHRTVKTHIFPLVRSDLVQNENQFHDRLTLNHLFIDIIITSLL
jgi:hypothetical protein